MSTAADDQYVSITAGVWTYGAGRLFDRDVHRAWQLLEWSGDRIGPRRDRAREEKAFEDERRLRRQDNYVRPDRTCVGFDEALVPVLELVRARVLEDGHPHTLDRVG